MNLHGVEWCWSIVVAVKKFCRVAIRPMWCEFFPACAKRNEITIVHTKNTFDLSHQSVHTYTPAHSQHTSFYYTNPFYLLVLVFTFNLVFRCRWWAPWFMVIHAIAFFLPRFVFIHSFHSHLAVGVECCEYHKSVPDTHSIYARCADTRDILTLPAFPFEKWKYKMSCVAREWNQLNRLANAIVCHCHQRQPQQWCHYQNTL